MDPEWLECLEEIAAGTGRPWGLAAQGDARPCHGLGQAVPASASGTETHHPGAKQQRLAAGNSQRFHRETNQRIT